MTSTARPPVDIAALKAFIGKQETADDVITPELVNRFVATVGGGKPDLTLGSPAPVMIHHCLAPPVAPMADLGPDGHPARGLFLPPVPLPRRMWAGGELRFHAPCRVGDTVRRTSRISDIVLKEGRTGRLCFVTLDHRYEAAGQLCLEERQDVVYRDAETGGAAAPKAEPAAPAGEHRREIDGSPTLLFRYSALTFNGHRIHYDRPYTIGVEGYPGLIVHGPLQATLLVMLARDIGGRTPATFAFRSLSPLFDGVPVVLNAAKDGAGLKLWTARPGGPVAMSGTARG